MGGRVYEHLLSSRVFIFAERCSTQSLIKSHMSGLASGTVCACACVLRRDSVCLFTSMTTTTAAAAATEGEGPVST